MKFIYAVIDTNVLVSALLKPESNPGLVIQYIREGCIVPLLHKNVIAEYEVVINRAKFSFDHEDIKSLLDLFSEKGIFVEPSKIYEIMHESDRIFYSITMEKEGSYLVTGNTRHFPRAHWVLTPSEAVELITNLNFHI